MNTLIDRRPVRLVGVPAAVAIGVVAVASGSMLEVVGLAALAALVGVAYLMWFATPALLFSLALAAEVLNGNAKLLGFPIAPDRLLVAAGIGALVLRLPGVRITRMIVWRPVHGLLAVTAAYAAVSALAAHTLTTQAGFFALLDRLGVVPFLVFTLAPIIYGDRQARNTLLVVLVVLGAYLGVTALAEALGIRALIYPKYILDPSVGIHFGRARGPFTEAVANGLGLYGCAAASIVAAHEWQDRRRARMFALGVAALCVLGTVFTLTRAVWLGTIVASVVALAVTGRTRAMLARAVPLGIVAVLLALALVPGLSGNVQGRQADQIPIWDRYNSNHAALRAVRDKPLFGVGWQAWQRENVNYLRVAENYPLTGTTIEIHNVLLSHAAELGLIGSSLWLLAFLFGIGGAVLRPGPESLEPWRLAMIAIGLHWLIAALFGPLSYPFPTLLLWTWAGVCSIGHLSRPLEPV